jgi:hypothetical protein
MHQEDDNHLRTKADIRVKLSPAKEHPQLRKAGRGKKGSSPRGFRGSLALPALSFQTLSSEL